MRNGAPLLLVLSLAVLVPSGVAAENLMLTGKPVSWEIWEDGPQQKPMTSTAGETLETPNQARRRLGLPLVDSFPAMDTGVAEETPNHRRQRESQDRLAQAQPIQ